MSISILSQGAEVNRHFYTPGDLELNQLFHPLERVVWVDYFSLNGRILSLLGENQNE